MKFWELKLGGRVLGLGEAVGGEPRRRQGGVPRLKPKEEEQKAGDKDNGIMSLVVYGSDG